jgi:hypothetical protein
MTANAANATFLFDTFTIPYINTQYLNVASTMNFSGQLATFSNLYVPGNLSVSNLSVTGNLYVTATNLQTTNALTINNSGTMTALKVIQNETSIHTHNVAEFWDATVLAMVIDPEGNVGIHTTSSPGYALTVTDPANFETLYIRGKSGQTTLNVNGNVYASNALSTTNIFATGSVVVGPPATAIQANLHVEQSNIFIGNSAITGSNWSTSGSVYMLNFDNSANPLSSGKPNKITLFSNTVAGIYCGIGVTNASQNFASLGLYSYGHTIIYNGLGYTTGGFTNSGTLSLGGVNAAAKFYVMNETNSTGIRIDSTNYALVTSGSGRVGFGTLTPSANLHVLGNVYASNAVTTTNVFTTNVTATGIQTIAGLTGLTSLNVTGNVYVSNAVTTTNLFANTLTMSNAASTINVTGNLYVSNAITTTNLICAGFTSNVSNTIFNYDTLVIPFISCTTLNVASTANVLTLSIPGSTGQTTLNATGNIFASNALTTTNVFGATETLTGATGRTTSTITGNVYVSNALTTTNVFATTVSATNPIPFRNRIINGAMNIWQRNTASISTTTGIYTTADRWCGALGTSGLILSQWPGPTEAPQFPYSLQVTTSTTTSGTPLIEQHIENLNIPDLLNGTPVSVSFYAGQSYGTLMPLTVGLYYGTVVNNFGTQTLAVAATQNTPTLTAANVYYSLSFTLTSSLGATNGLSLRFTTGGASAVGSTVLLTGVQLEKGAIATPFEMRPYATELALCQRYYYQLTSPTAAVQGSASVYAIFGTATGITTTAFWLPIQFPVTMRTPNYTFSNSAVSSFQLLPTGTTTITSVGLQTDSFTPVSATLNFVGTNIVAGSSYIFRTNNLTGSTTAFFGFSCEL